MTKQKNEQVKQVEQDETPNCFVIKPISDPENYDQGHFSRVYQDIFKPACEQAGYYPTRADEVTQTNFIHLDILEKLIESPMAICDLSTRNPNVLFELGLRQAFDKPTVLVQEFGTPQIFDIAPIRIQNYRKDLKYREVLDDQNFIAAALLSTNKAASNGDGANSIIRLLSIVQKPAELNKLNQDDLNEGILQLIRADISSMQSEFRRAISVLENRIASSFNDNIVSIDETTTSLLKTQKILHEAQESLQSIEIQIETAIPPQITKALITKTKNLIFPLMNRNLPDEYRKEVVYHLNRLNALEDRLIDTYQKNPNISFDSKELRKSKDK